MSTSSGILVVAVPIEKTDTNFAFKYSLKTPTSSRKASTDAINKSQSQKEDPNDSREDNAFLILAIGLAIFALVFMIASIVVLNRIPGGEKYQDEKS